MNSCPKEYTVRNTVEIPWKVVGHLLSATERWEKKSPPPPPPNVGGCATLSRRSERCHTKSNNKVLVNKLYMFVFTNLVQFGEWMDEKGRKAEGVLAPPTLKHVKN